eukprot:3863345-Prorocentrum_lima.AAC.1
MKWGRLLPSNSQWMRSSFHVNAFEAVSRVCKFHGPAASTALLRALLNGFIFTRPGKGTSPEAWCPWSASCPLRPCLLYTSPSPRDS